MIIHIVTEAFGNRVATKSETGVSGLTTHPENKN